MKNLPVSSLEAQPLCRGSCHCLDNYQVYCCCAFFFWHTYSERDKKLVQADPLPPDFFYFLLADAPGEMVWLDLFYHPVWAVSTALLAIVVRLQRRGRWDPQACSVQLKGRTAIVTGANTGRLNLTWFPPMCRAIRRHCKGMLYF